MNLTLKINGIDRTSNVVWDSLEKSDVLNEKVDTLRFSVRKYGSSTFGPAANDEVEMLDGSDVVYKGLILTSRKFTEGQSVVRYDVDCVDHTHKLSGPLVLERYTDKTIDYIIDDIITKYDPNAFLRGIAAHYKLNGDATDSSGSGNNGTAHNLTYGSGKIRQAGIFNGTSSYVNAGNAVPLSLSGNSPFTLSVWFYPSALASGTFPKLIGWYGGNYLGPMIYLNSDNSQLLAVAGKGPSSNHDISSSAGVISTNQWQHAALTYDGERLKLYLNGSIVADEAETSVNNTSGQNLTLGKNPWDNSAAGFFNGRLDDARVYSQALTPLEIAKLYGVGVFTTNNVNAPVEVKSITFNRISVSAALEKLGRLSNYSWYLDYQSDIHFFEKNTEPAPFSITDTSANYIYDSLEVTDDISQLRNRVYVLGGEAEGDARTEKFDGDGSKVFFKLSNKFSAIKDKDGNQILFVTVGGAQKTIGVDFLDNENDFDVLWNYNEKYIKFTVAPPAGTDNVEVTGRPLYSVSAQVQDPDSIEQYGLHEFPIVDKTIKSKEEARKFAASQLEAYAEKISEGRFETYTPGLRSGQIISINSASRGISESFLIQKVTFRMVNKDVGIYSVDLATLKTITIIDFLLDQLRLGTRIIEEQDNEILEKFIGASETLTISEGFSFSTSHNPQAETVTVAETFTPQSLNYAVEFVVGPSVPTGTKRQFVLNGSRLS